MDNRPRNLNILVCAALWIIVLIVYWPVTHYGFINYDDPDYVTRNPWVLRGLAWNSICWAFSAFHSSNWHPLTWLSHMLDVQIFGMNAGGHHLVNVFIHGINSALVFLCLRTLTGTLWRSAIVAALFGLHPLHVESVAWISERKDLLSTFFALMAVLLYGKYSGKRSPAKTALVSLLFALSLMAKPMFVTLPFVLLLIDIWPLQRLRLEPSFRASEFKPLLLEKLPLFALSAFSCIITVLAQQSGQSVLSLQKLPLLHRVINSIASYSLYLSKAIYPSPMAVFYPYEGFPPPVTLLISLAILLGITWFVWKTRRSHAYLLVGWLLFLGSLVPVIGLIQVGDQAMADRYTYFPYLGLFIAATWGMAELLKSLSRKVVTLCIVAAIATCCFITRTQVHHWKDTFSLFRHADSVVPRNYVARTVLGTLEQEQGRFDAAMEFYRSAIEIKPHYPEAHYSMGSAFASMGNLDQALEHYLEAVSINPNFPEARRELGKILIMQKKWDEAEDHLLAATGRMPDDFDANFCLAMSLHNQGKLDEAVVLYRKALAINNASAPAYSNLGSALVAQGKSAEALEYLRKSISLAPTSAETLGQLAWILSTHPDKAIRNGAEACAMASRACELTSFRDIRCLVSLSAALAETGQFEKAVDTVQKARTLAADTGATPVIAIADNLARLYQKGVPFREGTASPQ